MLMLMSLVLCLSHKWEPGSILFFLCLCLCLCASENSIGQISGFVLLLLLLLMLMSRVFSLAYAYLSCLCLCYAYALVRTGLVLASEENGLLGVVIVVFSGLVNGFVELFLFT